MYGNEKLLHGSVMMISWMIIKCFFYYHYYIYFSFMRSTVQH